MGIIHFTDAGTPAKASSEARALVRATSAALRAPSVFNTQPWRWRVADSVARLYADRSRQLSSVDSAGRLLTVSCGVALHHATTALAADGHVVEVRRIPDLADPDLLAEVRVAGEVEPDPRAVRMLGAITVRHTDRRPFSEQPVPAVALERLRLAAERHGVYLHILRPDQVVVLAAAASRAAEVELTDPAYRKDLVRWGHRPADAGDGVPAAAAADATTSGRKVPLRQFHLEVISADESFPRPADHAATFAILFADSDDAPAWLAAGEGLSEVLLTAAGDGVAVSPMSDVVEVEITRQTVRSLIGNVGYPIIALRIGVPRASSVARPTPRRGVNEVIEVE